MVRKEDVDFYCGFSRKELQSLCKKYNLPANRSSSDMAESLASYFEKNSLNSVSYGVVGNQDRSATTSRGPTSRTWWDVKRDCYGNKLNITGEDLRRQPGFILKDSKHYQEGNVDSERAPPYKKLNGKAPSDSRLDNRVKEVDSGDSPSSSSFEFHVSLEEGISLSVDLNFNPSEWINSMRDKVNVYDSMHPPKIPRPDLVIDNTATKCKKQKSSGQDKDVNARREPSLSLQVPSNHHHSNGEPSVASSAIQPCSINKEGSDACKDNNGANISSLPCVESYSKSCCVNPVDLDSVDPPGKKLTSDSVILASEQNHHPAGETPVMEGFQKVGNSSTVICPRGAGSELSSSETAVYHSNPPCSPTPKISSSVLIIDRESTSYSEYNGGKSCLPPNTEEQEKSEVLSEQARSE